MMNVLRNAANAFFGAFWRVQIEDTEQSFHMVAATDNEDTEQGLQLREHTDPPTAGDHPAGDGSGLVPAIRLPHHIHRLHIAHDFLNEIVVTLSEGDERINIIQKTIHLLGMMHRSRLLALGSATTPVARRELSPVVRVRPHPFRWSDCTWRVISDYTWRVISDCTWRVIVFASVGLVCSTLCPMLLSTYRFRVIFGLAGLLIFGAVFGMRFIMRDVRPTWWWVGILNAAVGLIAFESGSYPSHLEAIYGFTLLTAAIFCMISIIEPSTDYGLLLLSSLFPIQVVVTAFPTLKRSILEAEMYLPIRMVAIVYRTSDSYYVVISPWYAVTVLVTLISMMGYHYQRRRQ